MAEQKLSASLNCGSELSELPFLRESLAVLSQQHRYTTGILECANANKCRRTEFATITTKTVYQLKELSTLIHDLSCVKSNELDVSINASGTQNLI